jgi:excisionase family DNA binding protein
MNATASAGVRLRALPSRARRRGLVSSSSGGRAPSGRRDAHVERAPPIDTETAFEDRLDCGLDQLVRGHRGSSYDKSSELEMARSDETSEESTPGGGVATRAGRGRSGGSRAGGEVVSLIEPLLDCEAAAVLLNVRVSWVRDAARLGQLPCLRVGRHLRFTRVMLEDWLMEQFERVGGSGRSFGQSAIAADRRRSVAYRPRTEAALLATLAEGPKKQKGGG